MIDDSTSLDHLIHIFHRMHSSCMRRELEKRGLGDIANPGILYMLHHACTRHGLPGLSQKTIADMMGVAPPTVAVSAKRMERLGLIRKEPDEGDLRKNRITFTDKGLRLTEECLEAERALYKQVIYGLPREELETMCTAYRHMIDNMREYGVRHPHFCTKDDGKQ